MQARKVGIEHGWLWIKRGLNLIFRSPLLSVVLAAIVGGVIFLAMKVPLFGPMLGMLLLPMLVAGYMKACRAIERHEEAEIAHLFAGFGKHAPRLVALGGFLLVGIISIVAAIVAFGGNTFMTFLERAQEINDPAVMQQALQDADPSVLSALLIGLLLLVVLSVCVQFAPMLVLFDDQKPLAAIKASIMGTLRNVLPYTVYSLILQLVIFAIGMFPLFIAIVLVLTISMTSLYAAYRDLFGEQQADTATGAPASTDDETSPF